MTTPYSRNPPPGWHRDPAGVEVLRWWDGRRWTGHTAPLPPPPGTPARFPPEPEPEPPPDPEPEPELETEPEPARPAARLVGRARSPRELAERFTALGDMTGMTRAQIEAAVGPPTSRSYQGASTLLKWIAIGASGGYRISLLFDVDDVFESIQDEG